MDTLAATMELSYDDVAYEEQLPTEAEKAAASLAKRIGTSKVYLLAESSVSGHRKRKNHDEDEEFERIEEEEMDLDPTYRHNAILLHGTPISHLPTTRIFAYAEHFNVRPMGLEWVDDSNCVLVFEYRKDARDAFARLQKPSTSEEPDMDEMLPARSFPVALWPPEERITSTINSTLGTSKAEGLKGPLRMRWARVDDVKKKNAMQVSQFYKRHGTAAGKELFNGRDLPPAKRARRDDERGRELSDAARRAQLDDELDEFLARSDSERDMVDEVADAEVDEAPASPPSKMRSDYIAKDGRSLLDRTSTLPEDRPDLASRITAPLPRRAARRTRNLEDRLDEPAPRSPERRERRERGARGARNRGGERPERRTRDSGRDRGSERPARSAPRPKKTQQELDDELDAFLRG